MSTFFFAKFPAHLLVRSLTARYGLQWNQRANPALHARTRVALLALRQRAVDGGDDLLVHRRRSARVAGLGPDASQSRHYIEKYLTHFNKLRTCLQFTEELPSEN